MSSLTPIEAGVRPLAFLPARTRTGRTGLAAIASISPLRPVEASLDAQGYADALTTAVTYAADARRSAWLDDRGQSSLPRSRPADAALADLGSDDGTSPGPGASAAARNVTPGGSEGGRWSPRGIVAVPTAGAFAAAARSYRQVASLVA